MEYKFEIRNHWWFDAGIVGLYFIASEVKNEEQHDDIKLDFDVDGVSIYGENEDRIRGFLEHCYKKLAAKYWNVSTKSQKERLELVLYNPDTEEFSLAPKRNPIPVVERFKKGTSWKAEYIKYEDMEETLKKRVDKYLDENNKELWGNRKDKLLFTLPECQPKLKILPTKGSRKKSTCSICGKHASNLEYISQPSFLLFASKNAAQSFHTQGNRPAKLCWECEFLSKFTMDIVNYKKEGKNISILLLNSPNIEHNINNQRKIGSSSVLRSIDEDYFNKNIGFDPEGLIKNAKMPYELLWAYFVDTYSILKSNVTVTEADYDDIFLHLLGDINSAPVEIIIFYLEEKQQTFLTKDLIFYNDVSYAYRLIDYLLRKGIDLKSVYNSLYETNNKGKLLPSRNTILRKVLNKNCILLDVERIIFKKVINGEDINVSNLLKFLQEYYLVIKEDIMNKEQIDVAVKLGKQIVNQAYEVGGKDKNILKRIKGDLYSLRKARTVTDFITQLNTLQFRYGISVSTSITEGVLNDVPFEDFKGYCIMGALNSFNYLNSKSKNKEDVKDE